MEISAERNHTAIPVDELIADATERSKQTEGSSTETDPGDEIELVKVL